MCQVNIGRGENSLYSQPKRTARTTPLPISVITANNQADNIFTSQLAKKTTAQDVSPRLIFSKGARYCVNGEPD
jgi:hypothetical protein